MTSRDRSRYVLDKLGVRSEMSADSDAADGDEAGGGGDAAGTRPVGSIDQGTRGSIVGSARQSTDDPIRDKLDELRWRREYHG